MCGFLYSVDDNLKDNLISHRGLERGFLNFSGINFIHYRLPIQTLLNDKWKQPIQMGDLILLYNGEIFNFPPKYKNDVDYLLDFFKDFYDKNIDEKIKEINGWDGFWSILIYNKKSKETIFFTDPLGKKQLYTDGKNICSEISPLIKKNQEIDKYYKGIIYKFGYNIDNRTPYENIQRVIPNNIYKIKNNQISIYKHNYFKWNIKPTHNIRFLLKKSIQDRLISKHYKIGLLLSGGLDSTILAYLLNEKTSVEYYSIDNNEFKYIDIIEKDLGIQVNKMTFPQLSTKEIKKILKYNETPIDLGSLIPQHLLFSQIKTKIVISGDGADELFGGYNRINIYDSQKSDIFGELVYYHLPRLDRASMRYTIELRNPFISHDLVRFALSLPYSKRINKNILKEEFKNDIPSAIIMRSKYALKTNSIRKDKIKDRYEKINIFYKQENNEKTKCAYK